MTNSIVHGVNIDVRDTEQYFDSLLEYYSTRPVYSYKEVVSASTEYFDGDILAGQKFADKYALKDPSRGFLELTPDDMHIRLAREFARAELLKYENESDRLTFDQIYNLMKGFRYIVPQGSPMYGIGNPFQYISVSNCFVVSSPADSYGGIMKTDQQLAQISKRRGGVGTDISTLRPSNTRVKNAALTTTGSISFAERFSNTIREVGQNGRRGALMLTTDIHHPDVIDFINVKSDATKVTGANLSVRLSDEFLEAVKNSTSYDLRFAGEVYDSVDANTVWNTIIHQAWSMAEPGILFWDNILRESPADCYADHGFRTICTNPCAEIAMSAYDACRLLLQNLFSYVINPFTPDAYFDYETFYAHTKIAERLLDDLVDIEADCITRIIHKIESDPEDEDTKQEEITLWRKILDVNLKGRRTGNGVTAVGDVIAALSLKYDSDEGIAEIEKIYTNLKHASYESSIEMAEILGPFSCYNADAEKDCSFIVRLGQERPDLLERMQKSGRRNIALLTTAPTGSVSIMTQTSGGIEPEFSIIPYIRRTKGNPGDYGFRQDFVDQNGDSWMNFLVVKPKLRNWLQVMIDTQPDVVSSIMRDLNSIVSGDDHIKLCDLIRENRLFDIHTEVISHYPEDHQNALLAEIFNVITSYSPWHGSCAPDLDWKKRVELQSRAQKHVDHAISSTVNLPNNATKQDVADIYMEAWRLGCKGMTVYRDGCRTGVLVGLETPKPTTEIAYNDAPKRPKTIDADVYHITYKKEPYFVFVGLIGDGEPYEIFAGKNGFIPKDISKAKIEKIRKTKYRAILDNGEVVDDIGSHITDDQATITRLISLALRHGAGVQHCVESLLKVEGDMMNFGKTVARALKKYIPDGTDASSLGEGEGTYVYQEGCVVRLEDGWTKCM